MFGKQCLLDHTEAVSQPDFDQRAWLGASLSLPVSAELQLSMMIPALGACALFLVSDIQGKVNASFDSFVS